jgi:hypothetical protein
MAPFDFPASPASGDVYAPTGGPAYQYDGEKWKGGQPSGPVREQFFNLAGLTQVDIPVPSWAKACKLDGLTSGPTANAGNMRVSVDGTTFLSGANDYNNAGSVLNSGTGNAVAFPSANSSAISFTVSGDNAVLPHQWSADFQLERGSTSYVFAGKVYGRSHDANPATVARAFMAQFYVNATVTQLRIAALRIFTPGTFQVGSYVRVKWLGDAAQVPISNAIPDAPSDGYPYQRVNGIWQRQKGVVQIKTFFDSTDYSRAASSEAILGAAQIFYPFYPDSKVYWEFASYITVTTNAANMDDLRGHLYGKYYDGVSAYVSTIGNTISGHVNYNASTVASSVFYTNPQRCAPMDISTYRDPNYVPGGPVGSLGGGGRILMRMYGYPGYANSTLDLYETTMKFTEVLE